jgi:hypothetical protein
MLIIHSPLPDVRGRKCVRLLCQQFEHHGKLVDEVNAVFFVFDDDSWHKVFFDCGVLLWKAASPLADTQPIDGFNYPIVDLLPRFPLADRVIENVSTVELSDGTVELRLRFFDAGLFVLRERADKMDVYYEPFKNV